MHEYGLATTIFKQLSAEVENKRISKILDVTLDIGEYNFVDKEELEYCIHSLMKGSLFEGSHIVLNTIPGIVHCERCGYQGPLDFLDNGEHDDPEHSHSEHNHNMTPIFACPKCYCNPRIIQGQEIIIKQIKYSELSN